MASKRAPRVVEADPAEREEMRDMMEALGHLEVDGSTATSSSASSSARAAAAAAAPAGDDDADADVGGGDDGGGDDGEGDGEGDGGGGGSGKRRRRKKKKKGGASAGGGGAGGGGASGAATTPAAAAAAAAPIPAAAGELVERLAVSESVVARDAKIAELKTRLRREAAANHSFWHTQPVPKIDDTLEGVTMHAPIEPDKTPEELRAEPLSLPTGYKWDSVDMTNPEQLAEVYELLAANYVEDDENMFRFNYSPDFLQWSLTIPGFFPDWHVGVRAVSTGKLYGFISGIPATMHVFEKSMRMCEINFLCVHKKLRSKRLAPVLIKEVTRRVNMRGMFQAVYTAGVVLPRPVAACQYWHRSINPKKLIDVRFSRLAPRMTMPRTIRLYSLPDATKIPGLRPMEPRDVPQACALLNVYLKRFRLRPEFEEAEFAHMLLPRAGVINSYVVEEEGVVTDMISFYHLPSSVIGHPVHKDLLAVYSYYNVPGKHTIKELMSDALILAKKEGVDVFNALDLMENETFLKDLKFGPGDGHLQYYLYNWACPQMDNAQVGLVLL